MVRATPSFSALVRHGGGQRGTGVRPPFASPFSGVALTTEIPGGKASGRPFALTVDECLSVWLCNLIVALCVVVCL